MKTSISLLFMIIMLIISSSNKYQFIIPTLNQEFVLVEPLRNKPLEQRVYDAYIQVANNLIADNLITITAQQFAKYATIVGYCESDFNTTSHKLGQQGIAQITTDTRAACNIPDQISLSIEKQIQYHEIFLRKCSTKALRAVKSSIDFHALNFAPSRTFKDTLSKVTNKHLAALDFTKDNIITREDFKIFQSKRIKQSSTFMRNLYNNKM